MQIHFTAGFAVIGPEGNPPPGITHCPAITNRFSPGSVFLSGLKLSPGSMCGGIVSESLVQALAADGIELGAEVIQRAIDSYSLHMDVGDVCIAAPRMERRIASLGFGRCPERRFEQPQTGSGQ